MEIKRKNVYAQYFAIEQRMSEVGMHIDRAEIIADFTEGRTESLKDLTVSEYRELIQSLNAMINHHKIQFDKNNQMRRKVIAILTQCGYVEHNRADMQRINQWCISHGHKHCILNEYDTDGLRILITQAENMLKTQIEAL